MPKEKKKHRANPQNKADLSFKEAFKKIAKYDTEKEDIDNKDKK